MRQHIFVTGQPGIGKSTLIQKVLAQLSHQTSLAALNQDGNSSSAKSPHTNIAMDPTATGFYTEEVRVDGERVGFDVVTLQCQRGTLARTGTASRVRIIETCLFIFSAITSSQLHRAIQTASHQA